MEKLSQPTRLLNRLFKYRGFQAAFGLAALALAYVFASLAIDHGSLLDYAITLLLVIIGLRELTLVIMGRKHN